MSFPRRVEAVIFDMDGLLLDTEIVYRAAMIEAGSTFGIPAAKLGLAYAASGTRRLVDIVGPAFAKEIFFTARRFTCDEALSMGLINRVFSRDTLEAQTRDTCAIIAENAPLTMLTAGTVSLSASRMPNENVR